MLINFKQTPYLESVKENGILNDDEAIFSYVQQNLKFKYDDVAYPEFKVSYVGNGWLGRKVIALPAAIWFGVVKTIYHLTKLIFIGIQSLYSEDMSNFKIQYFRTIRNFQESFGYLVSLFNDQYGQYHIQESKFHQSCYDCFEIDLDKEVEKTKKLEYSREKDLFFAQLARLYFYQNNLKKANELMRESSDCFEIDLDKEVEKIEKLKKYKYSQEKNWRCAQLAKVYFNQNNLEKANELMRECTDFFLKEDVTIRVATKFYEQGNLEKAFLAVKELSLNSKEKAEFIMKIATRYCDQENLDEAFLTVRQVLFDSQEKTDLIERIANKYIDQSNLERASLAVNDLLFDSQMKIDLIARIARKCCDQDDLEKAFLAVKELSFHSKEKADFIMKIATRYCDQGNLEKAFLAVKEPSLNSKEKADFIMKIATRYCDQGNLEKAFLAVKELSFHSKEKADFIMKIAIRYYNQGNLEKAFLVVEEFPFSKEKSDFTLRIMDAYYERGNLEEACKVIKKNIRCLQASNIPTTALFVKIAKKYYEQDNLHKVLLTIKSCSDDINKEGLDYINQLIKDFSEKEMLQKLFEEVQKAQFNHFIKTEFTFRIATLYRKKGALKKSLDVITSLDHWISTDIFIQGIVNEYLERNELENAFSAFKKIELSCVKNAIIFNFAEAILEIDNQKRAEEERSSVENDCIFNVAKAFLEIDNQKKAEEIMSKCTDSGMKAEFSKLKSEAGPKQSESSKKTEYESFGSESISGAFDDYTILGLKSGASEKEIEKAFRNIAFVKHPDKIKQEENESDEEFIERRDKMVDDYSKALNARDRLLPSKE